MITGIVANLLEGTRGLAQLILFLFAAVYVPGAIIVNAFLWDFGVARIEFFQPDLLGAGILFATLGGVGIIAAIPVSVVVSRLLRLASLKSIQTRRRELLNLCSRLLVQYYRARSTIQQLWHRMPADRSQEREALRIRVRGLRRTPWLRRAAYFLPEISFALIGLVLVAGIGAVYQSREIGECIPTA
jgi:hypothetical protein